MPQLFQVIFGAIACSVVLIPKASKSVRLCVDYKAGKVNKIGNIFTLTKRVELDMCSSALPSTSTFETLFSIFAKTGHQDVMVSDNATIFKGDEFTSLFPNSLIFQKTIAPGHPVPNGLVESAVQALKKHLLAMPNDSSPIFKKIRKVLCREPLQNLYKNNNSRPLQETLKLKLEPSRRTSDRQRNSPRRYGDYIRR
uniref:Integrase catalytic domain-containing protein n=1 Tax=Glossina pallidipes TaxID=7398 RepID=A0A1A9ZC49_GLOPL